MDNSFSEYYSAYQNVKYHDKYIQFDKLDGLLSSCNIDQPLLGKNNISEFYRALDLSYSVTKNFADKWMLEMEQVEGKPFINHLVDLQQFSFINQEALLIIIKKHDLKVPKSKLMTFWRYSTTNDNKIFCFICLYVL